MSLGNMSFANMSPADRMKASVLITLIVVVLFIAVHFVTGSVMGRKSTVSTNGAIANGIPAATPVPAAPAVTTSAAADDDPAVKIAPTKGALKEALGGDLSIRDPFLPLNPKPNDAVFAEPGGTSPSIKTVGMTAPLHHKAPVLPNFGSSALPPLPGASAMVPVGPAAPVPMAVIEPEPEVRVVGIITGDAAVATLQVGGRTVLARPWDEVVKGYRLISVTADSIALRHNDRILTLRVGSIINEAKTAKP